MGLVFLSFPASDSAAAPSAGKGIPARGLQQYFNELHSLESCGEPLRAGLCSEWPAAVLAKQGRPKALCCPLRAASPEEGAFHDLPSC